MKGKWIEVILHGRCVGNEQDKSGNDCQWFYVILSTLHLMPAKHATFAIAFYLLSLCDCKGNAIFFQRPKGEHLTIVGLSCYGFMERISCIGKITEIKWTCAALEHTIIYQMEYDK